MKKLSLIFFLILFGYFSAQEYSIVKFENIKIDGKLKIFPSKKQFLDYIGKPQKIEKTSPETSAYAEESEKGTKFFRYFKNGLVFLVYNNIAELEEIDLLNHPKRFVMFNKFKISSKTTIKELKTFFPDSFKYYEKELSLIRIKSRKEYDDEVQIFVKNGKVNTIYYWTD